MKKIISTLATLSFARVRLASPLAPQSELILFRSLLVTSDSIHNIHIDYSKEDFEGEVKVVYGDCDILDQNQKHHDVASHWIKRTRRPSRLVWIVPKDIVDGGCLHAYSGLKLMGRSTPIFVKHQPKKREEISKVADMMGPWFDGVAYMQSKHNNGSFVTVEKSRKIAIVGGGMSGLMTSLLLDSVGIHNWHIIESSHRIGGRIRTKYLAGTTPDQYQYQEMGPMRFPVSTKYAGTNETLDIQDHKMVFQLADVLNRMNGNDSSLFINFIPWIQTSDNVPANSNGFRLANGRIPSAAMNRANRTANTLSAAEGPDVVAQIQAEAALEEFIGTDAGILGNISSNIYQAHKEAVEKGLFNWSEAAYLRYALNQSTNVVDFIKGTGNSPMWQYDRVYSGATTWRTIDKGLESLPRAFLPHVQSRLTLGRKIAGLEYASDHDKVTVKWRQDPFEQETQSEQYDYAVVSAPFSKSCKVALHYKTRFWEKLSPPIIGGCGSVDVPGVGSVCYPSYKINSTGPGVILGSYLSGSMARSLGALSTADHIALVQRAMVEVHGEVANEQFTGAFDRQCWETDEHSAGAWAAPLVGQQDLYLPAYYKTEMKTIFIGEHTSYTHAWIFSALDSAVRGTSQLLLDMGLVDEANQIVEIWMGKWIHM